MSLLRIVRPLGNNGAKNITTSSTASSVTFTGMTATGPVNYYLVCISGSVAVALEFAAGPVTAATTTSLTLGPGVTSIVSASANATVSAVSASASSVSICPVEGAF
jgi:hypothetical protein